MPTTIVNVGFPAEIWKELLKESSVFKWFAVCKESAKLARGCGARVSLTPNDELWVLLTSECDFMIRCVGDFTELMKKCTFELTDVTLGFCERVFLQSEVEELKRLVEQSPFFTLHRDESLYVRAGPSLCCFEVEVQAIADGGWLVKLDTVYDVKPTFQRVYLLDGTVEESEWSDSDSDSD